MNIERIEKNSVICAVVRSEEIVITDIMVPEIQTTVEKKSVNMV